MKKFFLSWYGRAITILILVGLIFVAINLSYFWQNLRFSFSRPRAASVPANQTSPPTRQPNLLTIPSLGIFAPIVYASEPTEKSFQAALINGVVHYPGTALPGQAGNVYIFGHSSDYITSPGHYKTVFALLPRISKGAEIEVTDGDGHSFKYRVVDTRIVGPGDVQYLAQDMSKKVLTVQTSYPLGTALKRFLVIAELEQ